MIIGVEGGRSVLLVRVKGRDAGQRGLFGMAVAVWVWIFFFSGWCYLFCSVNTYTCEREMLPAYACVLMFLC